MVTLINDDCLKAMADIPDGSIDLCLTDPPYGTTACKWDTVIPFEPMWAELKRIVKPNGAICLFGSEPFSSYLRISNIKMFKYDWIWRKNRHSNFLSAKKQPKRIFEVISVFYSEHPVYQSQKIPLSDASVKRNNRKRTTRSNTSGHQFDALCAPLNDTKGQVLGEPVNIIEFKLEQNNQFKKQVFHPTQKPAALLEYLIKTYTLEGETVLDFTMGSGSTGVACKNLSRKFIGIEQDKKYFDIAMERINGN